MGPTVWLLEGPTPMRKRSNAPASIGGTVFVPPTVLNRPIGQLTHQGRGDTVSGRMTMTDLPDDVLNRPLAEVDPEIAAVLRGELARQQDTQEKIASENIVARAVQECQGSVLTNKYAEGYPGKRYYGGCEWVDVSEGLAIDRARALFGGDHVNVQT